MNIQIAKESDIPSISQLLTEVYGKKIIENECHWRFVQNPILKGRLVNVVAENVDKSIVGHTAFLPSKFKCGTKDYTGACSISTVVSDKFPGLFPSLYHAAEKRIIAEGADFLYGFPNEFSFPFFLKLFRYSSYSFEYLSVDPNNLIANENKIFINGLVNQLDQDFLEWRINHSPLNKYHYHESEGLKFIYKEFDSDQLDILAIASVNNCIEMEVIYKFVKKYGKRANIYCTDLSFTEELKKIGFEPEETRNRLVYKIINPELQKINLSLQMIDSDIF